jgi:hypothetical protein
MSNDHDSRPRYFVLRNANNPVGKLSFAGNTYQVPVGETHQDELKRLWNIVDDKELMAMAQHACAVLSGRQTSGEPIVVTIDWYREEAAEEESTSLSGDENGDVGADGGPAKHKGKKK